MDECNMDSSCQPIPDAGRRNRPCYTFQSPHAQICYTYSLVTLFSVLGLLPSIVAAVFSALRVFALLDRGYFTSIVVFLLSIVPVVTNIYGDKNLVYVYVDDPVLGCSCYFESFVPFSVDYARKQGVLCLCASTDTLHIIIVTWTKTYQLSRGSRSLGLRSISTVLFRDGSIYFIALFILNALQLFLDVIPSIAILEPVSNLNQVLPSILISRFLVNLRLVDRSQDGVMSEGKSLSVLSTPNFCAPTATIDRVVGPMGESLNIDNSNSWERDSEDYRDVSDLHADEDPSGARCSLTGGDIEEVTRTVPTEL
ncbi:hypothetical protein NM688_g8150 [Phlebia brevispora]|uniref:Uncharacterized protein n=1 Tax=Phlebia brevispora TaxID=194682 RepID=A0ACC1RWP4_9APHY|nr:hypothetical protein NM688_g8150 [Phlebia brevispora]